MRKILILILIQFIFSLSISARVELGEDGYLYLNGSRFYIHGINYWPRSSIDKANRDFWLMPQMYDPEEIEYDINKISELGFNVVSIMVQGAYIQECQQNLIDFLNKCREKNIQVSIFITGIDPIIWMDFNRERFIKVLDAIPFEEFENIFAVEFLWEARLGNRDEFDGGTPTRDRVNTEWNQWLINQYGSYSAAQSDLGSLPSTGGPLDAVLVYMNVPQLMRAGDTYTVTIKMKNIGQSTWQPGDVYLKLVNDDYLIKYSTYPFGESKIDIESPVSPGEIVEFNFNITAPSTPGIYAFVYRLYSENGVYYGSALKPGWFGGYVYQWIKVVSSGNTVSIPVEYSNAIATPSDSQVTNDNASDRPLVAAFRSFIDDWANKRIEWMRQIYEEKVSEPRPLFMARWGYAGQGCPSRADMFGPLDHEACVRNVDILAPEGYYVGAYDFTKNGGFNTIYARYVANYKKPVVWWEFGYWMPPNPDATKLNEQKNYWDKFYGMILDCNADGSLGWWYPGGYRVDENSDFGIVNPDGSERPVCDVIRLRRDSILNPSRTYNTTAGTISIDENNDRFSHTTGYVWLLQNYYNSYNSGYKVVTPATGKSSDDSSVTGKKVYGTAIPRYMDAEFNYIKILNAYGEWQEVYNNSVVPVNPDSDVQIIASVQNAGEIRWLKGPVGSSGYVFFGGNENKGDITFRTELPEDVDYLENVLINNAIITDTIDNVKSVAFQMVDEGHCWFGETMKVYLYPVNIENSNSAFITFKDGNFLSHNLAFYKNMLLSGKKKGLDYGGFNSFSIDVSDSFIKSAGSSLYLIMDYYDFTNSNITLQYESFNQTICSTNILTLAGSKKWKKFIYNLNRVYFNNGCNNYDLILSGDLYINSIKIQNFIYDKNILMFSDGVCNLNKNNSMNIYLYLTDSSNNYTSGVVNIKEIYPANEENFSLTVNGSNSFTLMGNEVGPVKVIVNTGTSIASNKFYFVKSLLFTPEKQIGLYSINSFNKSYFHGVIFASATNLVLDIDDNFLYKETQNLYMSISYLDKGNGEIEIIYNTGSGIKTNCISLNNTGVLKEQEITLEGVYADNNINRGDLVIKGSSIPFYIKSIALLKTPLPSPPQIDVKNNSITINWEKILDNEFKHYAILRKEENEFTYKILRISEGKQYVDTDLYSNRKYIYKIGFADSEGNIYFTSLPSDEITFITGSNIESESIILSNPIVNLNLSHELELIFNQDTGKIEIKLFTLSGKLIYHHEFNLQGNSLRINLDEIKGKVKSGIYFIKIKNQNKTYTKKVIFIK